VAEAFDGVEQGQLRTRVRDLAAHDEPRALWVAVVGDQAGDLGDLRADAQLTVGADRRNPLAYLHDRLPHVFGDRDTDREPGIHTLVTQATDMSQQSLSAAG